ncbi:MAG TPA: molybdopterin biosynthesis protein [Clostridiaceae bacterium]|nr:molybdopterin biosynthesis protein [Clostridiaceae bacterium]
MENIFLSNMELDDALKLYMKSNLPTEGNKEKISTLDSFQRVTSMPVYSLMSSPFYNSSAMDGIAVLSSRTFDASEKNQITLVEKVDYVVVDTGDPIPRQFDCVVMVEDLIRVSDKEVKIYKSASPWQHIRTLGEDIVENQLIIPSNHVVRSVDIGAMLAGGANTIEVYRRPRVGIIPTGTEIVEPGSELKIGDIVEFNSRIFSAQIQEWGGIPVRYGIVRDDREKIKESILKAVAENDIVLVNAGSSADREDFTSGIIEELGKVHVHGIAIKPGKPTILGEIDGKPVVGIPGYPVSAYVVMENIVKKIVYGFQQRKLEKTKTVEAFVSKRIMSSLKYLEFVRVKLGRVNDKLVATPLSRGAGTTMSLVRADGIICIPQSSEGIEAGTKVAVQLIRSEEEVNNTLVSIGSHDVIMDVAADLMSLREKQYVLSSSHVGSMGGILALRNGETHMAPIHLLDEETGEYNVSYIRRYIKDKDISLIKCVKRIQGLMVKKGNPLGINSLNDIAEVKASFVNRQRGSGTRLLLDYNMKKLKIDPADIPGYDREEFTHLKVAAAVAAGDADCGLGVYSAAVLMDLDFIPLCHEEYDLAVPTNLLQDDKVKEFIEVIRSDKFIGELNRLGGYEYDGIGRIITV